MALTLELGPGAALERELYVAAVSLGSGPGSRVGRDLFAVSLDAGLNGRIEGQPHTAIGPIQLYNGLMRLLGFEELTIKLHIDFTKPPAAPAPSTPEPASGSGFAPVSHLRARRILQAAQPFDWNAWTVAQARDWLVLALFGLLAFAVARPPQARARGQLEARPWPSTGTGLLGIVMVVNLFGLALLLAVLLFSIGLGLNFLGLWQLSIALWIASYSALALALVGLWLLVVFGTKIIVVHALTGWLLDRGPQPAPAAVVPPTRLPVRPPAPARTKGAVIKKPL
jgi:hypothetical protein